MEFTLVTSHEGTTLQENMQTMDIIFVHPEYLIHMGCDNIKEYIQSIVHVTTTMEQSVIFDELKSQRFAAVAGLIIFRHTRTNRSALVSFHSEHILIDQNQKTFFQVCNTKVRNIRWQENDKISEWIGHVEAKLCLSEFEEKCITRENLTYYAFKLRDVPSFEHIREQIKILKCQIGTNVAFPSGTQRAICIPKSLFETPRLQNCPNNGAWCILNTSMDMMEYSHVFAETFNVDPDDRNFRSYLERTQTIKQFKELYAFLRETIESGLGTVSVHPITYTRADRILDIELTFVKSKSVVILYVAK